MKYKSILLTISLIIILGFVGYYFYKQSSSQLPKADETLVRNIVLNYIKENNITSEAPTLEVRGSTYQDLKIITYSADVYFRSVEQPKTGLVLDYYSIDINADTGVVIKFEKKPICTLEKITTRNQAIETVKNKTGKSGTRVYLMSATGLGCNWYVYVGEDSYEVKGDGTVRLQSKAVPF